MTHIQDEVRELLQRKANDLPPHLDVPGSIDTRVRRRIALNALVVGIAVVVVAGGVLAGLRSIGVLSKDQPAQGGNHATAPPPSSPAAVIACTSSQLSATAVMGGAAGSRGGTIDLTNTSDVTCTLTGTPQITLLDPNQQPITPGVTFRGSQPGWEANGAPTPSGWPVVTLAPGDVAQVRILWSNWCPDGRAVPVWNVGIPGGGESTVTGIDAAGAPPCNGPGLGSTISVGPFEPKLSA